jgi:hypothetical protein
VTVAQASSWTSAPSSVAWITSPVRRLLRLSPGQASFATRGFTVGNPSRQGALEEIGRTFIGGYNIALSTTRLSSVVDHVARVPADNRGFAAEGAAMGAAVVDALEIRGTFLAALLEALGRNFTYLIHVGAGWSLAYVPWRRRRIAGLLDPVHGWLAFDGLGFRDTYFHHARILAGWRRSRAGYAARAYDQGIGRALWFITGGDGAAAAGLISGFPAQRQSDLWSGLGLAMAYAGPIGADEIESACQSAGAHRSWFAQGVAFACEARVRASYVPPHTELVARVVCDADAHWLAQLTSDTRAALPESDGDLPRYEVWRQALAAALASKMECRQ